MCKNYQPKKFRRKLFRLFFEKSFNASLSLQESKIKVSASPYSQLGVLPGAILMTDFTSFHAAFFLGVSPIYF